MTAHSSNPAGSQKRTRKSAIIVCPGRGTYNAPELGYLSRHHSDKQDFLAMIDRVRAQAGQESILALDKADKFLSSLHGRGDNASLLIYACAVADFMDIDRDKYEVVGVTGNSMGWYLSLAVGEAAGLEEAAEIVNTMGGIMTEHGRGGQIVYSCVDEDWRVDETKIKALNTALLTAASRDDMFVARSIDLGGMAVLAGDEAGLGFLMSALPKDDRFPFRIRGHSAFHSALLDGTVPLARAALGRELFDKPEIPMIDGRGNVWRPFATDSLALYEYTFGQQINQTYHFTRAIDVAAKEYAPDLFIILGPGTTMGAPVAQSLIASKWDGLDSKAAFKARQGQNPIILSMGIDEQRRQVIADS